MNLDPEMAQMFSNLGATTLYRVVSVLQAPFVMEDGNGRFKNMNKFIYFKKSYVT
jgi:hypothetical protein